MSKQLEIRHYNIPDADLKQLADGLVLSINRDINAFATRNTTHANVSALQTLIDLFDNSSTDLELLGQVTTAAETKDALADNLRKAIRVIRNIAETAFGDSGKYSSFGFDGLARLSDNDLYRLGRRVSRVGMQLQPELSEQGLTIEQLLAINSMAGQFDAAIDNIGAAIEKRNIKSQDRVLKGNALWAEMMRLASIGQSLFEDTDEALYNDYILAPAKPPKDGNTATTLDTIKA